jgi:hypothetical protein
MVWGFLQEGHNLSIFDTGITDAITQAIENTSKAYSNAIVEGFELGARIIADKLQEIEDGKK